MEEAKKPKRFVKLRRLFARLWLLGTCPHKRVGWETISQETSVRMCRDCGQVLEWQIKG
jgi:hypothetical protein